MIKPTKIFYEKIETCGIGEDTVTTIEEVEKKDATHKHICFHDPNNPEAEVPSCKRIPL